MIELFKQPPVIAALITLVGAAIVVPLVKKFYFDTRSRLRVEVRAFRTKTGEGVKKIVVESLNAKQQYFDPIRTLIACNSYAAVTITNISKKKIVGVTAMSPRFALLWQLDGPNEAVELQQEQIFAVGDIQPKHSQMIHLWCMADMSAFDFGPLKKRLVRVSADELDSVRLRFPTPRYVVVKYLSRMPWILAALSWSITIGVWVWDTLK